MLYQRLIDIDHRLQEVLRLVRTGRYSTPDLAAKLGVSIPTISRDVTALRQRGHTIVAERVDKTWRYRMASEDTAPVRRLANAGRAGR